MSARKNDPEEIAQDESLHEYCEINRTPQSKLEQRFEDFLWSTRRLVLIAVISALAVALMMFVFVTVDVVRVIHFAWEAMLLPDKQMNNVRLELLAKVVKIVDLYLVATFMLIFALGLYELFIGKINTAEKSEVAHRLLLIHDLDDLKSRLVKIVMLILTMLFLEYALRLQPRDHLDLLWLALGSISISGALFLSQKRR